MQVIRNLSRWSAIAVLTVGLAACTAQYRNHGYVPNDEDLSQITVGVDTRDTVAEVIGTPSSSGVLKDGNYYYVRSRLKHFGWQKPEVVERQVLAINFTKSGVVQGIGRYSLEDGRVVPLATRFTRNGQDVSFIRKILSNIGNFSAGDLLNQ